MNPSGGKRHDGLRYSASIGQPSGYRVSDVSVVAGRDPGLLRDGDSPIPALRRRAEILDFSRGHSYAADGTQVWRSEPLKAAVVFLLLFARDHRVDLGTASPDRPQMAS